MINIDENKISYFVRVNNKCIDVDNGYIIDEDDGMDYFYCDITELFETNERGVCLLNRLYKNATDREKMFVKMRLERKASDADELKALKNNITTEQDTTVSDLIDRYYASVAQDFDVGY